MSILDKEKMSFGQKIIATISLVIMSPMLRDDPKSTEQTAKKMFWEAFRMIWRGEK